MNRTYVHFFQIYVMPEERLEVGCQVLLQSRVLFRKVGEFNSWRNTNKRHISVYVEN